MDGLPLGGCDLSSHSIMKDYADPFGEEVQATPHPNTERQLLAPMRIAQCCACGMYGFAAGTIMKG